MLAMPDMPTFLEYNIIYIYIYIHIYYIYVYVYIYVYIYIYIYISVSAYLYKYLVSTPAHTLMGLRQFPKHFVNLEVQDFTM